MSPASRSRVRVREWFLYEAVVEADDAQRAEEIAQELREMDMDTLTFKDGDLDFCDTEPLDDNEEVQS